MVPIRDLTLVPHLWRLPFAAVVRRFMTPTDSHQRAMP